MRWQSVNNYLTRGSKFLLILPLILGILVFHNESGVVLWKLTRLAKPALLLNQKAEFARDIGNYYFNVYGDGVYDLDRAEHFFRKSIELDPNVPDAWHQLARIDFLRGDFFEALQKINKQLELHGDSFMASYYIRGLIYGYSGNFALAEKDFKKFLEWDPENWAANNDLAWIYFSAGEYKKAEDIARQGLEKNPGNTWLLVSLGASLLNQGEKTEAKTILLEAKSAALRLSEGDWNKAYPGNHPRSARKGLEEMLEVINHNLVLLDAS